MLCGEIADAPVVGEQVTARQELGNEIDETFILVEAVVLHLRREQGLTMKGCEMISRIFFSFSMWSTCLLSMISLFFMALMAYLVDLSFLSQPTLTLPNAPGG